MEPVLRRVIREDVELRLVRAPDLPWIHADLGQLEQVILNLAVNARDAMPRGGRLLVGTTRVELDEAAAQRHERARAGTYAVLAVQDNGCGMDEETLGRIFEPFFTTKPRGQGTGMGLSGLHGIVEQSGGHVLVHSVPGEGSTFEVYFPAARTSREEGAEAPSSGPPRPEPPAEGRERILVVEDLSLIHI